VRFSRTVRFVDERSLQLVDDAGAVTPAAVTPGDEPASYRLLLAGPLGPLRRYHVEPGALIRDSDGEPPFHLDPPPAFTTGTELRTAPIAIDRIALVPSSGCLVARFATSLPALATLCLDGDCPDGDNSDEPAPAPLHELLHPLAPGRIAQVTLRARDESTAPEARAGPSPSPRSSPRPLVITEVLSHPLGPRLAQQFVEIENRGAAPVALAGLQLHDDAGFDELPEATLAPGALALIVPDDFTVDDGVDRAPAPGTLIVRIGDGRLGANGIRESGEAIALTEDDGRPVSLFSTVGLKLAKGQSAHRTGPCDVAASYEPTPGGGATPGVP
jgi:hypothetical protein